MGRRSTLDIEIDKALKKTFSLLKMIDKLTEKATPDQLDQIIKLLQAKKKGMSRGKQLLWPFRR